MFFYLNNLLLSLNTAQKMKFTIKNFFSKCHQIRRFLRIWSHLLKKSFMENFIFSAVKDINPVSGKQALKKKPEALLKSFIAQL